MKVGVNLSEIRYFLVRDRVLARRTNPSAKEEAKCKGKIEGSSDYTLDGALWSSLFEVRAKCQPTLHVGHFVQSKVRDAAATSSVA